jgi:hypothetical protein
MNTILIAVHLTILPVFPDGGNHLVLPVTTDLQRTLLGKHGEPLRDARAYVLVNGEAVMSTDGMINSKALDLPALRQQLAPFADANKGIVYFKVYYSPEPPPSGRNEEFLLWALYGFAVHSGFRDARVGNSYLPRFNWETLIARVNEAVAGESDGDESPIGNELVKVYPVRTILGRYLTSSADCVVDVLKPYTKDGLAPETLESIKQFVAKMQVKKRRVIEVRIWSKDADGQHAAEDFMINRDAKAFAELFGFEESSVSHTPR